MQQKCLQINKRSIQDGVNHCELHINQQMPLGECFPVWTQPVSYVHIPQEKGAQITSEVSNFLGGGRGQ